MPSTGTLVTYPAWNSYVGQFVTPKIDSKFNHVFETSILSHPTKCYLIVPRIIYAVGALLNSTGDMAAWVGRTIYIPRAYERGRYHWVDLISAIVAPFLCLGMPLGYLPWVNTNKNGVGPLAINAITYYRDMRDSLCEDKGKEIAEEIMKKGFYKGQSMEGRVRENAELFLLEAIKYDDHAAIEVFWKSTDFPQAIKDKIIFNSDPDKLEGIVNYLFTKGLIDINQQYPIPNFPEGTTLLMLAINYKNWDFCQFLIEKNADLNAKDSNGMTALSHVLFKHSDLQEGTDFAARLIGAGADLQKDHFTELHQAMKQIKSSQKAVSKTTPFSAALNVALQQQSAIDQADKPGNEQVSKMPLQNALNAAEWLQQYEIETYYLQCKCH